MEDISKLNKILDELKFKYNITQPTSSESFTLEETIALLANLETKYRPVFTAKTKYGILEDLVSKLEFELCVKESKNVDLVLNEIIKCLKNETLESKGLCAKQINKMLETNYFNSNIKKKLMAIVELMV